MDSLEEVTLDITLRKGEEEQQKGTLDRETVCKA